jgi:K+/H+ antiporter YhaU regulatory subunit KhtT
VPGLAEATAAVRQGGAASAAGAAPGAGEAGPAGSFDPEANRRAVWHQVQEIGINAVIVVTITLASAGLSGVLGARLPAAADVDLVLAGVALVLCAPSAIFIFRCGSSLARLLSQALAARLPWMDSGLMRGTLAATGAFLFFLFLQVAFLPLLLLRLRSYNGPVLIAAAGLTVALAYFLYRALRDFQRGLTGLVRTSLSSSGRAAARLAAAPGGGPGVPAAGAEIPAREAARTIVEHLPLPECSTLAGRLLGESGLRERAGVSVLGIERGGEWIGNPDSGVRLEAADELVVLGSQEQRELAERMIAESAAPAGGAARQDG